MPCPGPRGEAMRRRSKAGGEQAKKQHRKAVSLKRRNAPKAARRRSSAAKETEVARLTRELHAAQEQQTATAEVLKIISFPHRGTAQHAAGVCRTPPARTGNPSRAGDGPWPHCCNEQVGSHR